MDYQDYDYDYDEYDEYDEYDFNNETFERWFYGKLKLDEYDFMLNAAFEAEQELALGIE
jgi:hypothetical protein